ncbi:glutamate receptor 2.8-like [Mangifera indica]|uniref:glutamate receptor 2.8-like n=1 Tax=Mangifera indica TaxID=29780 RepID=UPI001CFB8378|nr:glutamate receptor 2.8-like [Mangifera indica]
MSISSFHLFFFHLLLLLLLKATANGSYTNAVEKEHVVGSIGAIVDLDSRIGKEEKIAMEMAMRDFNVKTNQSFHLLILNSQKDPVYAAFAAKDLIETQKVEAILGPQTWEETEMVANIGSQAQIPILSLAESSPQWASERWPFLVQTAPSQHKQMKAIAAMVQAWEWHQVTVIYEDTGSSTAGIVMPHLYDAFREADVEIINLVALPPFDSSSLAEKLEMIKLGQCRVIVVDLSFPLATRLFEKAKEMEMMAKDYVWITTAAFSNLVDSINGTSISSMQGIIGVQSHFPINGELHKDFHKRFRAKFTLEYPEEDSSEPSIYAVQANDAVWTVCSAMSQNNNARRQKLLDTILHSKFNGLGGEIQFIDKKFAPGNTFRIINVLGKSYRSLGFWSESGDGIGFSRNLDERASYNPSMKSLKGVIWPENNHTFGGYAIDLFKETVRTLPYYLAYEFIPIDGKYDALVQRIHNKTLHAVVGDVTIVSSRLQYAEFTHPYTEPGLVMVVPVRSQAGSKAWLFMKPFTKAMWGLTVAVTLYDGFVVWLIERNHCSELKGSVLNQSTTLIWLSFSTLFSLQAEKLHSSLSRMAMVVWLFVALVITQTYTANLTSILTVQRLEPTFTDIGSLQRSNAMIGYCKGSYLEKYLVQVLKFNPNNIKFYSSSEDYAQALRSKEVEAIFLDVPIAKIFTAKYCKEFTAAGPTYKSGGFGFVFPKGSPLVPDMNKALLNLSECGKLRELENKMLTTQNCEEMESEEDYSSISVTSYWVLFTLTGFTSTLALAVYGVHLYSKLEKPIFGNKIIWRVMSAVIAHWRLKKKWFCRKVSDIESPTSIVP